ncbi:MIP/aquaporin family protein [Garciella nitratireducens]|uniref:MIP/aquaporin family protein n=1 Tax=Garciella nitratireducens TaxID=218205 RepID=UPI000DEB7D38|nr:MIP/aquaporin family protein [Garciella nitratireducens]RBP46945.1 glycerol uptake facilitator protein [Garciella nitratireducens]
MSSFLAELVGTMLLVFLGDGVCAATTLNKSKAQNGGWIVIATGWALAVAIPAWIFGEVSGAHLNPALTISLAAIGQFPWTSVPSYIIAQMIGGVLGATLVWLMYLPHWEVTEDSAAKRGIFCTAPGIRNTGANLLSEILGTFVLVFAILGLGRVQMTDGLGTFAVGLLIFSIGLSLGGPTGYAINPARDLAPRIAHAILPIAGKGDSDWGYAWIPVIGPIIGGLIGAFLFTWIF